MPVKSNSASRWFALQTFFELSPKERRLIWRTVFLVGAVRVALWLVPLRRLGRVTQVFERLHFSIPAELSVSRLEWAVLAASRRVPMASCLTQALALQCLLARSGRFSEVHIGIRKDAVAGFQ